MGILLVEDNLMITKGLEYSFKQENYNLNVATNLKKLQEAADYFLKNCYTIGIEYEQ